MFHFIMQFCFSPLSFRTIFNNLKWAWTLNSKLNIQSKCRKTDFDRKNVLCLFSLHVSVKNLLTVNFYHHNNFRSGFSGLHSFFRKTEEMVSSIPNKYMSNCILSICFLSKKFYWKNILHFYYSTFGFTPCNCDGIQSMIKYQCVSNLYPVVTNQPK